MDNSFSSVARHVVHVPVDHSACRAGRGTARGVLAIDQAELVLVVAPAEFGVSRRSK
jgi:hypothetical protein